MSAASSKGHRVDPKAQAAARKPNSDHVADFHTNSDLDAHPNAQHHTLGPTQNQAAPGSHLHDGSDSALILGGLQIVGAKGTPAWYLSVNQLLARLGAIDNST